MPAICDFIIMKEMFHFDKSEKMKIDNKYLAL